MVCGNPYNHPTSGIHKHTIIKQEIKGMGEGGGNTSLLRDQNLTFRKRFCVSFQSDETTLRKILY